MWFWSVSLGVITALRHAGRWAVLVVSFKFHPKHIGSDGVACDAQFYFGVSSSPCYSVKRTYKEERRKTNKSGSLLENSVFKPPRVLYPKLYRRI